MTWQWVALAGLALVALFLLVALARLRGRTARQIAAAHQEAAQLRDRLDRLEQERSASPPPTRDDPPPVAGEPEYRITRVGDADDESMRLEREAFADHVLRESVIRLGALAHGLRRALHAETRNRIRFEMKREVKRARKQRRAEQRQAYREWQARQREALTDDELRESA